MSFFEQLQQLRERQPAPAILTVRAENCPYCPYHASGRNCYMILGHNSCEDCYYGFWVGMSRDCVDGGFVEKCEMCYECVDCQECYDCNFCQDCYACSNTEWCYDCKGCQNCYGSVNLRNKQFHIFNKAYSKEDYFRIVAELKKKHPRMEQPPAEWLELKRTQPHNGMQGVQNENVIGDHIFRSRNVFYGFDVSDQEDTMFAFNASNNKDSLDFCNAGQGSELIYMCHSAVALYNSNFCSSLDEEIAEESSRGNFQRILKTS